MDAELPSRGLPRKARSDSPSACRVAAGLLAQDVRWLPLLYLIIMLPTLLSRFMPIAEYYPSFLAAAVHMFFVLAALYLAGVRWLSRLSAGRYGWSLPAGLRLLAFALLTWLPVILLSNFLFSASLPNRIWQLVCLLLFLPALGFFFRYYFGFMPLLMHQPLRGMLALARRYTIADRWLSVKALAAPFALETLAVAMIQSAAPDGRLLWVSWLVAAAGGLFWLLAIYLGLGFGVACLDEHSWQAFHLDAYREGRLATLAVHAANWVAVLLKPSAAIKMLIVSVLITLANVATLLSMPPAPSFSIQSIAVEESRVTLQLRLADEKYLFRGFNPYYLHLAGENRAEISSRPSQVYIDDTLLPLASFPPTGKTAGVELRVVFETNRSMEGLKDLEDLYLWYLAARISHLDMKAAKIATRPLL